MIKAQEAAEHYIREQSIDDPEAVGKECFLAGVRWLLDEIEKDASNVPPSLRWQYRKMIESIKKILEAK